ncbi:MAG TPA: hypothetical protein VNE38_05920, partial [Ktedonobacteraceae bacterium]|nr:hypothetical protein [Ktedonobacteraceae bacterium]
HKRLFEGVKTRWRYGQPRGNNDRRAHQLHFGGIVPARTGSRAVRVVQVGDAGAIAHQEVAIECDTCEHDDMVAGWMSGIRAIIAQRKIVEAAFRTSHNNGIARPQPGAQYIDMGGALRVGEELFHYGKWSNREE